MNVLNELKMKVELLELEVAIESLKAEYNEPSFRRRLVSDFGRLISKLETMTIPDDTASVTKAAHLMRRHLYLRCKEVLVMLRKSRHMISKYEKHALEKMQELFTPMELFVETCKSYFEEQEINELKRQRI